MSSTFPPVEHFPFVTTPEHIPCGLLSWITYMAKGQFYLCGCVWACICVRVFVCVCCSQQPQNGRCWWMHVCIVLQYTRMHRLSGQTCIVLSTPKFHFNFYSLSSYMPLYTAIIKRGDHKCTHTHKHTLVCMYASAKCASRGRLQMDYAV